MQNTTAILIGPTSSGKTGIALEFCKRFDFQIISADSRQAYKYMDVGTGKVPSNSEYTYKKGDEYWEVNNIKIWGYDLVSPGEYFSAYDFKEFATNKIAQLKKNGTKALVVGGTGFFVDALTGQVKLSQIKPDLKLRDQLEKKSTEELSSQLNELNPEAFKLIDKQNRVRLIRAIEKNLSTDKSLSHIPDKETAFKLIGLTADRERLYSRVDGWAESIWNSLLFDELKFLIDRGWENTPQLQGLVYKTALSHLHGEVNSDDGLQRVKFDLHAYIRRQQTWFKKTPSVKWLDLTSTKESILFELENAYN